MKNLYEADKAVKSSFTHFINVTVPADLESAETKAVLTDLIVNQNIKTSAIGLIFSFVGDFPALTDRFQVIKNQIAFNRDVVNQSNRLGKRSIETKLAANYALISPSGSTSFYTSEEFEALRSIDGAINGYMVIELSVTNAYYL